MKHNAVGWGLETVMVEDACLRFPISIVIEQQDSASVATPLTNILQTAKSKAQQAGIPALEMRLSIDAELSDMQLSKAGFSEVLTEYQFLGNESEGADSSVIAGLSLSNTCSAPELLRSILWDQASIHFQLQPEYYLAPSEIDWHEYMRQLAEIMGDSSGIIVVASVEQHLVGCAVGWVDSTQAHLWELVISDEFRGQGIGAMVLTQFVQNGLQKGCKSFHTEIAVGNQARVFYLKLGWKPTYKTYFSRV